METLIAVFAVIVVVTVLSAVVAVILAPRAIATDVMNSMGTWPNGNDD